MEARFRGHDVVVDAPYSSTSSDIEVFWTVMTLPNN
jgi:hypothetical protein